MRPLGTVADLPTTSPTTTLGWLNFEDGGWLVSAGQQQATMQGRDEEELTKRKKKS
ncbi:hypothetical protein TIFTF001_016113 [Ficus carica]|uniref:Uncharacterized protein n=1 Tax=Ficus carica TaxID=3494 RepID=A0AA88D9L5_FICCA|nr:hypothetical protein TIFTF001_016113 [Ficus carica]